MKLKLFLFVNILTLLAVSNVAQSALIDRGRGMIYDDQLDTTWLQDANYAKTSGYTVANEVGFNISSLDHPIIIERNGRMSFASANQWAENLVYGGYDDWRLPTYRADFKGDSSHRFSSYLDSFGQTREESILGIIPGTRPIIYTYEVGNARNEIEYMNYWNLRNTSQIGTRNLSPGESIDIDRLCTNDCLKNSEPFINLLEDGYWTNLINDDLGDLFDFSTSEYRAETQHFSTYYAWAVRSGDVAVIPIPSTVLLFGSGVIALLGVRKKDK